MEKKTGQALSLSLSLDTFQLFREMYTAGSFASSLS
jgi:hypothetical protein